MKTLKIGDTIQAEQYGNMIAGEVVEITNNGCFVETPVCICFAHRDNITHINGEEIN